MKKTDFPYHVTNFFSVYLPGQKNLSKNTIASYAVTFKLLFIFCEEEQDIKTEKLTLKQINADLVIEYLDWLEEKRKCSVTTRNQRLVALHTFFRYLIKKEPAYMETIHDIINIPYKKAPQTIVPYMTEEQMKILLAQPDGDTWDSYRDKVMLSVLYDTGARVQELADLQVKNVRLESPPVVTLHGKGNKTRQVPIMESTCKLLDSYLKNYRYNTGISKGDNPLFVNQQKKKLSRWGITYIINKYVMMAQKDPRFNVEFRITPHVFRHSKAVHMIHAGINLIYIRDFLGHVDCATTEIYARIDTETKRKVIEESCKDIFPDEKLQDWNTDGDLMEFLQSLM